MEWFQMCGGVLLSVSHVSLAIIVGIVYSIRKDILPFRVVVTLIVHLLLCASLQTCEMVLGVTHHVVWQLLIGTSGLMAVAGIGRALHKHSGLSKKFLVRQRLTQLVLFQIPLSVLLVNEEMDISYAEGKALRTSGTDPRTLVGSSLQEHVFHPSVYALYEKGMTGRPGVLRYPGEPGSRFEGQVYYTHTIPVRSEGKQCVLSVTLNLTDTHEFAAGFQEKLDKLAKGVPWKRQ